MANDMTRNVWCAHRSAYDLFKVMKNIQESVTRKVVVVVPYKVVCEVDMY